MTGKRAGDPGRKPVNAWLLILGLVWGVFGWAGPTLAATFDVTRTDDPIPGGCAVGDCSLREAIIAANAAPGSTINLPAGTYALTRSGIEEFAASGDLDITANMTINGFYSTITANGLAPRERVMHVLNGAVLSMTGVTLTGGLQAGGVGGGLYIQNGGAIISYCTFTGNSASAGAGIYNDGLLTLDYSTIYGNNSTNTGGGLYNSHGPSALTDCTISGNTAAAAGGGVYNAADTLNLIFVTVAYNSASGTGGGICRIGGTVNLDQTLLAGNTGPAPDFSGAVNSLGYNLVYDTSGSAGWDAWTDILNPWMAVSDIINPLAGNGGPTLTHALVWGSPAIDAGWPGFGPPPDVDQRGAGYPRILGGIPDIGAYEYYGWEGQFIGGLSLNISAAGCGISASSK